MKPFNLAESRIAQRTYCQTHLNRRIRLIGLFAGIAIVVALVSCGSRALIMGRAEKARAELANVETRCAEIERDTESAKAQLDQRQWQDQLAKVSDCWLSAVDTTLGCLPDDVWLTRLETSPKDSTIIVEGRAATFDSLSAFIGQLHRNRAFSDIRLGSVRVVRIANLTCIDFSLPIKLKPMTAASDPAPIAQANALAPRRPRA